MLSIGQRIADELNAQEWQVKAAVDLLDGGSTVPFIARYRKEVTGTLDDAQLRTLEERLRYLRELEDRRKTILDSVREQGKLTDELALQLNTADTKARLEDLYLPYKPKRRTKAQIAREAGLEPLADLLLTEPAREPKEVGRRLREYGEGRRHAGGGAGGRTLHPGRALCRKCGTPRLFARNLLGARQPHLEGARRQDDGGRQVCRLFRLCRAADEASLAPHSRALPRREGRDSRPAHGGGQGERRTRLCRAATKAASRLPSASSIRAVRATGGFWIPCAGAGARSCASRSSSI